MPDINESSASPLLSQVVGVLAIDENGPLGTPGLLRISDVANTRYYRPAITGATAAQVGATLNGTFYYTAILRSASGLFSYQSNEVAATVTPGNRVTLTLPALSSGVNPGTWQIFKSTTAGVYSGTTLGTAVGSASSSSFIDSGQAASGSVTFATATTAVNLPVAVVTPSLIFAQGRFGLGFNDFSTQVFDFETLDKQHVLRSSSAGNPLNPGAAGLNVGGRFITNDSTLGTLYIVEPTGEGGAGSSFLIFSDLGGANSATGNTFAGCRINGAVDSNAASANLIFDALTGYQFRIGGSLGFPTDPTIVALDVNNSVVTANGGFFGKFSRSTVPVLTAASNLVAVNLNLGDMFTLAMTGNFTLSNSTNLTSGRTWSIRVQQDATGSRTLAYGSNYRFIGSSVLSTAPNAINVLSFISFDGVEAIGTVSLVV